MSAYFAFSTDGGTFKLNGWLSDKNSEDTSFGPFGSYRRLRFRQIVLLESTKLVVVCHPISQCEE